MKKIALFAVLFALVLTCAACGKKKPSADVSNDTTTTAGDTGTTTAGNEIGADDLLPTTGKPVTRVVTDKNGKAETTEVTRIVTDKNGDAVTDASKKPVTDCTDVTVTEIVTEPVTTAPTTSTTKPTTSTTKSGETTKISYEDTEGWSPIKPY